MGTVVGDPQDFCHIIQWFVHSAGLKHQLRPQWDALPLNTAKFNSAHLVRKGCPTTVWPTDVAKPRKMGWRCTNSPRTLRSFANGRSRCSAPEFIGWPHQTPTSAVSILGRSILNPNPPQALWNWGPERLPLCLSVHTVPPAVVLAVWSACLLSSGGVLQQHQKSTQWVSDQRQASNGCPFWSEVCAFSYHFFLAPCRRTKTRHHPPRLMIEREEDMKTVSREKWSNLGKKAEKSIQVKYTW